MIKHAIQARTTISGHMIATTDPNTLKRYVYECLSREMSGEIIKKMTIDEVRDLMTDTITYTGTLNLNPNPSVINAGAGTVSISNSGYTVAGVATSTSYSQINLRVVEYTKNGKVTRVELQKYDEENDEWYKIPRIQIEE